MLGIIYPQYLVLMVLWKEDILSVNEISEKLILNTNTVTPLLKYKEVLPLLTRVQSKADQRKVLLQLAYKDKSMQMLAAEIHFRLSKN